MTNEPTSTPRLTPKQKRYADYLLNNPKASGTEAVLHAYDIKNPDSSTARALATENKAKPSIQIYMDKHVDKAVQTIVKQMDSANETIAQNASKDILDRTHGKATQAIEQTTKKLIVTIDLSGMPDATTVTPSI